MARRHRRTRADEQKVMSRINVTPLVDVMLVLLIIFMITSPMLVSGVKVDLPKTTTSPIAGQDEPLAVSIDSKGAIYIGETKVSMDELVPKLDAIAGQKHDTRIFVRGDESIDYGQVMKVVGAINKAGFTRVALITNPQS